MNSNIKALLAKAWKDEDLDLEPGRHFIDETFTVRVIGTVEKQADQLVAPTTSIPLVPTLALVLEKAGLAGDKALTVLREALTEAMKEGVKEDGHLHARMEHVESAIAAVRQDLIAKLPKMRRSGRVITKALQIEVIPAMEESLIPAAV